MIITENCMSCGQCMEYCPNGAIAIIVNHNKSYGQCFILEEKCTDCENCLDNVDCPGDAIQQKKKKDPYEQINK